MRTMSAVLLCHAPEDDEAEDGAISRFREALEERARFVTGRPELEIVTDRTWVSWSTRWRQELDASPDECGLLVAVLTPRWFSHAGCRQELERFRRREQASGRTDLVVGVHWYPADQLGQVGTTPADELAVDLAGRAPVPWHEHRHEPITGPPAKRHLDEVAERIKAALGPSPAVRTRVVDPMPLQGDHTTITAAIQAAVRGDRIAVRPGAYDETLTIDRPVEIVGDGPVHDIVVRARGGDAVLLTAPIARVAGLTLHQADTEGDWYGVDTGTGRLLVEDCVITSDSLACVSIRNGADPTLRRNWISDGASGGVLVHEDGLGIVEDNEITGHTLAGVEITTGGDPIVRRNRITGNALGGVYVHDGALGTFDDNEITDNGDAGIDVETGAHPLVRRNRITGNRRHGIWIHDDGRITLEANTVHANRPKDVEIADDAGPVDER